MAGSGSSLPAKALAVLGVVEDALLVLLLSTMIAVAGAQIVLRNLFDGALVWADPLLRVAVLWVGMIGAMVATRGDHQITVDVVSRFLPERWRAGVRVVTDLFTAAVAGVVAWASLRLVLEDRAAGGLKISFVPVWVCEIVLPVAFTVIALRYLMLAITHFRNARGGQEAP